jgi:hypothetical protein
VNPVLTCRVLTTFDPFPNRPPEVLWEGVLDWHETAKPDAAGRTRFLKLQCGLRRGPNGPFITVPAIRKWDPALNRLVVSRDANNKVRTYVDVGHMLQRSGVATVLAHLEKVAAAGAPIGGTATGDMREAARQVFAEEGEYLPDTAGRLPGEPDIEDAPNSRAADDPFGELKW